MASGKTYAYSFLNVKATIDGQSVIGFWEGDDAVVVEPTEDVGTGVVGADGAAVFSQRAGNPHTITFRLMPQSPAHKLLHEKWALQRTPGMRTSSFAVTINDVDANEGGTALQCFIMTAPSDEKGVATSAREWVVWTGNYNPNIPNGGAIIA